MEDLDHIIRLCDEDLYGPAHYRLPHGEVIVYTQLSPAKDEGNEDSGAIVPVSDECDVLVVADGAGGMAAGNIASRHVVDAMIESASVRGEVRNRILTGIEHADERIRADGLGACSTCAAVEITGHTIRSSHVGDSLVLVVGQRGRIKHLTVSQSPVGYAVEAGILHRDDALHHEDLHIVSSMVGMEGMRIDLGPSITLAAKDTVLIASDGLSDNLRVDEIVNTIRKGDLLECAESLVDQVHSRMAGLGDPDEPCKPDDLTFMLYRPRAE